MYGIKVAYGPRSWVTPLYWSTSAYEVMFVSAMTVSMRSILASSCIQKLSLLCSDSRSKRREEHLKFDLTFCYWKPRILWSPACMGGPELWPSLFGRPNRNFWRTALCWWGPCHYKISQDQWEQLLSLSSSIQRWLRLDLAKTDFHVVAFECLPVPSRWNPGEGPSRVFSVSHLLSVGRGSIVVTLIWTAMFQEFFYRTAFSGFAPLLLPLSPVPWFHDHCRLHLSKEASLLQSPHCWRVRELLVCTSPIPWRAIQSRLLSIGNRRWSWTYLSSAFPLASQVQDIVNIVSFSLRCACRASWVSSS